MQQEIASMWEHVSALARCGRFFNAMLGYAIAFGSSGGLGFRMQLSVEPCRGGDTAA